MNKIAIVAGSVTVEAELNDSPTAHQIWDALPIEGAANTWGDEIYFEIPVVAGQEADARAQVEVGELGYWPVGHAFCIFFGPTPVSTDDRPRALCGPRRAGVLRPRGPIRQRPRGQGGGGGRSPDGYRGHAGAVDHVEHARGDATAFRVVKSGATVKLERI